MFSDQFGDGWAGAYKLQHVAVGIADEDGLGAAKLATSGDGDAVIGDEGLGCFCVFHLHGQMGNTGIFRLFIHQDVFTRPCCRWAQQVDVNARGVQHHQWMARVIAAIIDQLEPQQFIESDRFLPVADADADVVEVRDVEHVFALPLLLGKRYACRMSVTRSGIITSPAHFGHMPSVDRMREFSEVARVGSISEAARVLGLPRATLSRRMAALEAELGVRLILRRTTRLALTHAGEELQRRATRIVADADEAWRAVRRMDDTPRGLLRVSVTGPYFLRLFIDYLCDFPEVRIEVQSTPRHVDLLAEGVDVAMRIGPVKDQDLIARRLHTDRLIVVASPEYLETVGTPKSAKDLSRRNCIVGVFGDWTPNTKWPLWSGGEVTVGGRLSANDIALVREAALEGLGFALIASAVVADDVQAGRLIPVLVNEVGAELPVSLVYADREYVDPKVREFVDRAAEVIEREMPKPLKL